jgi:ribonucleoside-diphosphate reductase alpha chain
VVNEHLVRDLKKMGLWDEVMVADLKYFDGSLSRIDRIPAELRNLYATAFEVDRSGWSKPHRVARSGSTRRRA